MIVSDLIYKTEKTDWRKLKPSQPDSLKKTNPKRIEKLKKSLQKNGFAMSFFVFEKDGSIFVIDGHHRIKALKELAKDGADMPTEFTCSFVEYKNDEHLKKLILAFNSHYAEIDEDGLYDFIKDLDLDEVRDEFEFFDLNFDLKEPDTEDPQADEVPDVEEDTFSQLGDLYELKSGGLTHRVLCGDSTDKTQVGKLMAGKKADMVFTDPPYGVSYASKNEMLNKLDKGNRIQKDIKNDHIDINEISELWAKVFQNISDVLNDYSSYYVCSAQGGDLMMMMMMMNENGLPLKHNIIWNKNNHVLGRADYNYKHEPISYGWSNRHKFYGDGSEKTSVWNFDKPHKSDLHPTMKPVALIENALLNSTEKNMLSIDFFLGSGSTLIACEKTSRNCYGIEIDPHYIDVIIRRYHNYCEENDKPIEILKNGEPFEL